MSVEIRYSDGRRETAVGLQAALEALRGEYPELVAVGDGGWDVGSEDEDPGERVLVWESEEDSEDDDGARAVAAITRGAS